MILITGGSGFLGQAIVARLSEAHAPTRSDLDLTDGRAVHQAIADWKPTVVIHLAARVGGIAANIAQQADFLVDNLRIDANLLAALRAATPSHLISILSTCMYPDALPEADYPLSEDQIEAGPPPPTNAAYAAAKRALWHGTRALYSQYGVPYTCLVPANLYGPFDHYGTDHSHFLAAAIHKIESARRRSDSSVEFFGTGQALRQYVFVEDVAWLVAHLVAQGPCNATLNVAPTENRSIRELATAVAEAAGFDGRIEFSGDGPDGQHRKDVACDRLIDAVPQWPAVETSLASGLAHSLEWYRQHVEAS